MAMFLSPSLFVIESINEAYFIIIHHGLFFKFIIHHVLHITITLNG